MKKFESLYKYIVEVEKLNLRVGKKNGKIEAFRATKTPVNFKNIEEFVKNANIDLDANPIHCQFQFTKGNIKVGRDTVIVNMGAATGCPSAANNLCELYAKGSCYAYNGENYRPSAVVAKTKQGQIWRERTAEELSLGIAAIVKSLRDNNYDIKYVRMNESGDFYSIEDVEKLKNVVRGTNSLLDTPVTFYNYTHRSDLFPMGRNPLAGVENLVMQGSGYRKDMKVDAVPHEKTGKLLRPALQKGKKEVAFMLDNCFYAMGLNEFETILKGTDEEANALLPYGVSRDQVVQCPGDCFGCDQCKTGGNKFIVIVIHGRGSTMGGRISNFGKTIGIRSAQNKKMDNGLPFDDSEIARLYSTLGRNDYTFIDKLYYYFGQGRLSLDDLKGIWKRLQELRAAYEDSGEVKLKTWLSPTKAGRAQLKEPLDQYLLHLQKTVKKPKKSDEDEVEAVEDTVPKVESVNESRILKKKKKKLDLTALMNTPRDIANFAVSGVLKKLSQFVSPAEMEEEEMNVKEAKEVLKSSYAVQKKLRKIINSL